MQSQIHKIKRLQIVLQYLVTLCNCVHHCEYLLSFSIFFQKQDQLSCSESFEWKSHMLPSIHKQE